MDTETAVAAHGLTKTFGGARAVDNLDLAVPAGTIFGFLGTNGAGKSTTIRLLLGLVDPTSGTATVAGFDSHREGDQVRARCGVLLDDPGLYERLDAFDNLELYRRIWRIAPRPGERRIQDLLGHVGLWDRRHDLVSTFSLGMRKKLAMARALLNEPDVLFLDEPTTGLDPVARAALRDDILSLAGRSGTTVFLTTHDLGEAQRMCGLVGVMRTGELLATGSPAELEQRLEPPLRIRGRGFTDAVAAAMSGLPGVRKVDVVDGGADVRLDKSADAAPLVRAALDGGAEVTEVCREQSSLEEAFLSLVGHDTGATATPAPA